jgi:ParB-like chromosome segregation protein Spo0J
MEEARALRSLLDLGYSQEELARRLCKSPAHVSERLRLTMLPAPIQHLVLEGRLSSSAARNVARIPDPARQQAVALDLADGRYTVRQVEALMRELRTQPPALSAPGEPADPPFPAEMSGSEAPVVEPPLAEAGVPFDVGPLRAGVVALLAEAHALPVGLDLASQAAVRAALAPLAALLDEWRVGTPGEATPLSS